MKELTKEGRVEQYKSKLLSLLLNKYEKSNAFKAGEVSKRRPQFTIKKLRNNLSGDYFDEMDYQKRESIHQALEELQKDNIIEIKWTKFKEGEEVEKVYLNFEAIEQAYEIAQIKPKQQKIKQLQDILRPLSNHPWPWVKDFWNYYDERLSEKQTAGLEINDSKGYADLVKTLMVLPTLEEGATKRIFSHYLFSDTKYFERYVEKRLISIYKRFANIVLDTDIEYLDSIGIVENPQTTLVSGPLKFRSKNIIVDISRLPGGMGLTFKTIKELNIEAIEAKAILFIENLTAYHEFLNGMTLNDDIKYKFPMNSEILVIYTGGYPHHALRKFLFKLHNFIIGTNLTIDLYHWGDIDYGGILIFEHLRRNYFPNLKPLLMDEQTYNKYLQYGVPFSSDYSDRLASLLNDEDYALWHTLISALLKNGKRIEQEGLVVNIGR